MAGARLKGLMCTTKNLGLKPLEFQAIKGF